MKIAVCLLLSVFAIAVSSLPAQKANRVKRGFRNGAADRFSHGFGKRGEVLGDAINSIHKGEDIMSTEDLVNILRRDPGLLGLFVESYIDINGDGQISKEELFAHRMA